MSRWDNHDEYDDGRKGVEESEAHSDDAGGSDNDRDDENECDVTIDNSDAEVESDDDIDDEVDDDYHCNKLICFYDIHVIDRCRGNLIDPLCQYVCQICHPFRRLKIVQWLECQFRSFKQVLQKGEMYRKGTWQPGRHLCQVLSPVE